MPKEDTRIFDVKIIATHQHLQSLEDAVSTDETLRDYLNQVIGEAITAAMQEHTGKQIEYKAQLNISGFTRAFRKHLEKIKPTWRLMKCAHTRACRLTIRGVAVRKTALPLLLSVKASGANIGIATPATRRKSPE